MKLPRLITRRRVNWVGIALLLLIVVPCVFFDLYGLLAMALAVLVLSAVVGALRGRLEHTPGTCLNCGYDLTGLDGAAVCPECGEAREATT